ncbi:MAG: methylenetetrahydrofolate reductase, partial [Actinobacteria bacterium]|nr:methylenetetrahydrofolate reductase [Actinomycetota bacterium]
MPEPPAPRPRPAPPFSNLQAVLAAGHFAVTAELGPPKGPDPDDVRQKAALLRGSVDAASVTDNQGAVLKMSNLGAAILCKRAGVEPIMQLSCRDRNRLALQSDVISAQAFGIRNFMSISGDSLVLGDHPMAKPVFDLQGVQLVRLLRRLRDEGVNGAGDPIAGDFRFFIGGAANPFAPPYAWRPLRLLKKAEAGQEFALTQMIFNVERFKEWMSYVRDEGLHERLHILAGVGPLRSLRMAEFMKFKIAGMEVPDPIIERLRGAAKPRDEGIKICLDIIAQVREIEGVHGVHIMAIDWERVVPQIVQDAGIALPRPS